MNSDFQQARSLPEWITFIVATLILLGVVGLTLNEWRTQQDSPPFSTSTPVPRSEPTWDNITFLFQSLIAVEQPQKPCK
uniref:Uncharacterized protein n=1 Tax=Desertifilum tharense IPPAS B-1220 TaxID=1781255 RepID=A0ACD5H3L5_9CYAN